MHPTVKLLHYYLSLFTNWFKNFINTYIAVLWFSPFLHLSLLLLRLRDLERDLERECWPFWCRYLGDGLRFRFNVEVSTYLDIFAVERSSKYKYTMDAYKTWITVTGSRKNGNKFPGFQVSHGHTLYVILKKIFPFRSLTIALQNCVEIFCKNSPRSYTIRLVHIHVPVAKVVI